MKYLTAESVIRPWFFILPFAGNWNYDDPHTWRLRYPQCGGRHQSPIALFSGNSIPDDSLQLNFVNYGKPLAAPVDMLNNGYSVEVGMRTNEDGSIPHITVGKYVDKFEIQAVHFHWGSPYTPGSEHVIDGVRYDGEMHMVHKNSKYTSIEEARNFRDGFLVLSVLIRAVAGPDGKTPAALIKVIDNLDSIAAYNSTSEVEGPLSMESFISNLDPNQYFAYRGSLTTPPCSEAVLWFVLLDIIELPYENLRQFWNLREARGFPLINNFRPLQPANRPVFRSSSAINVIN